MNSAALKAERDEMMTLNEAYANFGNPVDGAATIKVTAADIRYWRADLDKLRAVLERVLAGKASKEEVRRALENC